MKLAQTFLIFSGLFLWSTSMSAQVEAIGQCGTLPDTYSILINGLDPLTPYIIVVDGTTITSGASETFSSGELTTADMDFVNGFTKKEVLIIEEDSGVFDTTMFMVNEVLCTDVDDDGTNDFNVATCDYTKPIGEGGAIVSTVAPFTGDNVYVYILVRDGLYTSESVTSFTGLFEDLENGDDYEVFAFNFLTKDEADSFIDGIPDDTDLSTYSVAAPACFALCGSQEYTVDCSSIVDIYVDPVDVEVCNEGDADFFVQDSFLVTPPPGAEISYVWEVDSSGAGSFATVTDSSEPDSVLSLSDLMFSDSGNVYRVIVTMTVDGTVISMDTSGTATLTIYDDPVLASTLDVTVNSDDSTGVVLSLEDGSIPADSFDIVSIDVGDNLTAGPDNASEGITTDSMVISGDTYTNTGIEPDTAFYTVVPMPR